MKKWLISVLCVSLCLLLFVGTANFLVDPVMQYRPLNPRLTFYAFDYDYINPGLAKNADYNAVLVGTSLAENTDMDYCESLFDSKMIKLIYPGGTAKNNKTIMDVAFRTHSIDRVLWTIDDSLFFKASDELSHELPTYLYDTNKFNDLSYLLNVSILYNYTIKDVLNSAMGVVSKPLLRGNIWGGSETYGYNSVMSGFNPPKHEPQPDDYYQEHITGNLNENIIPLLDAHPETEFDFFFPPKCVAYWQAARISGVFDAKFCSIEYLVSELLKHPNVRIFFYIDDMDWTVDFDLYRDTIHFTNDINNQIVEKIAGGEGELTKANYKQIIRDTASTLANLDYALYIHS